VIQLKLWSVVKLAFNRYKQLSSVVYSEDDHLTWQKLYSRQLEIIGDWPCSEWKQGFARLALPKTKVPDQAETSKRVEGFTGWRIYNAENEFLGNVEWFSALLRKNFPATSYIRRPEELDFTPYPDLFHEYMGHLPLMTIPSIAEITGLFAQAFFATPAQLRVGVGRLWWHTMEWGFVLEEGEPKAFGGGLMAGKNDFLDGIAQRKTPFSVEEAFNTLKTLGNVQEKYFIIESVNSLRQSLLDYIVNLEDSSLKPVAIPVGFNPVDEIDEFRKEAAAA